jgi:uncharacterized protein involved in exopolysaccharide biosynthesis
MPDQRETNMSRLIALQNNYQGRQESIQNLERTRALMRDQIATRKELLAAKNENFIAGGNDSPQLLSRQDKLERLRNELQSLEMRYTEKHPKIKSLKNNIAKLEQSDLDEPEAKPTTAKTEDSANQQVDEILINLEQQLKDISYSIAKITKEKEDIQVLISQYDKWVSVTPVREAEWSALTREYGELKRHYDFLMGQNLQAGSALNLERKQRGSQFKIEDFAQQPLKPVKPDFLKIMGIALLMGCGASVVGCFLLEKMDTSFRFPEQLEATFPFEVLCSVPRLPLKREIVRQRVWIAFGTMFFLTWGLGIIIALGLLWKQGRIII